MPELCVQQNFLNPNFKGVSMIQVFILLILPLTTFADSYDDRAQIAAARANAVKLADCTARLQGSMAIEYRRIHGFVRDHGGLRQDGICQVTSISQDPNAWPVCGYNFEKVSYSQLSPRFPGFINSCRLYLADNLDCNVRVDHDGYSAHCLDVYGNPSRYPEARSVRKSKKR